MFLTVILLTAFILVISIITTIPVSIGLLTIMTILFRKSWVLFLAFGLGLFLDLITMRVLGSTGPVLTAIVFLIWLYERKFETRSIVFVLISTFFGSLIYLIFFDYQQIFLQALINSLLTVIFFKLLWLKLGPRSEII